MHGSVHPDRNNVLVACVQNGGNALSTLAVRIDQEGNGGKRND
jgi:hypothetical protein